MTNLWSKYLLPAALAGLVLAETAGSGTLYRRESPDLLRRIDIAALQVDTLQRDSTAAASEARPEKGKKGRSRKKKDDKKERPAPPPRPKVEDVFIWDDDTVFFGPGRKVDTLPSITARDTMKVPDSLRSVNPFLYKWYVATKDSLIHRVVVDSLKAAGDSLDWPVIDSLYLADSAAVAKAAFDRWYASLSKAERKRYDYEQLLPKLLKQQDSILHRKDSIQAVRDSIRENTPRILATRFIPDSMQYKRFITWHHDRHFNRLELFDYDTTFRYHFYDEPFKREDVNATWLGVSGSPVQTYNFLKRGRVESVSFFEPYESWTYTPETLPMWNTKTPYTELEYYGTLLAPSSKESDKPLLNDYLYFGSRANNAYFLNADIDDVRITANVLPPGHFLRTRTGPLDDAIAYWPFDKTANMLEDASGNGNVLTGTGVAVNDGAAVFDGSQSGFATLAPLPLYAYRSMTVEWFMRSSMSDLGVALELTANMGQNPGAFNAIANEYAGYKTAGGYNAFELWSAMDGRWHHYALVYDRNETTYDIVRLYRDGSKVTTHKFWDTDAPKLRAGTLFIGTRGGSQYPFVGELDDIKITGRALDPSEFMAKRSSPPGVTIIIR